LNKEAIDFEKIKKAQLFIIAAPKDVFAPTEIEDLKKFVENGGNLLVFSHEGGDRKYANPSFRNNTNISEVTKKFGISINSDCVIRTSFYKYFHPK
jgi:intraflagellar transport protein 52